MTVLCPVWIPLVAVSHFLSLALFLYGLESLHGSLSKVLRLGRLRLGSLLWRESTAFCLERMNSGAQLPHLDPQHHKERAERPYGDDLEERKDGGSTDQSASSHDLAEVRPHG